MGANGNEAGAANLVAYQKFLRRNDISLTHTIVQPTIDKAQGDAPRAGQRRRAAQGRRHRARHRRPRRAHSGDARAVRRRTRGLSRRIRCPKAPTTTRCRSAFRWGRRGSSSSAATAARRRRNLFDHPLSSRFDEQDAFVIFDDVEMPRDRLFIDCNLDVYNHVMSRPGGPERHAADDDPRADQARVRLGSRDAHGRSDQRRVSRAT